MEWIYSSLRNIKVGAKTTHKGREARPRSRKAKKSESRVLGVIETPESGALGKNLRRKKKSDALDTGGRSVL